MRRRFLLILCLAVSGCVSFETIELEDAALKGPTKEEQAAKQVTKRNKPVQPVAVKEAEKIAKQDDRAALSRAERRKLNRERALAGQQRKMEAKMRAQEEAQAKLRAKAQEQERARAQAEAEEARKKAIAAQRKKADAVEQVKAPVVKEKVREIKTPAPVPEEPTGPQLTKIHLVRVGMTNDEVETIMGRHMNIGYEAIGSFDWAYKPILLQTPHRKETLKAKGKSYNIAYYFTQIRESDGRISDDELTPLIFEQNRLIGKGWEYLKALKEEFRF